MALQKLIEKYENENKSILNRRPDLTMQGDFTADGIKLFCNNGFIEDLRALAQMPDASENTLPIQNVSGSAWDLPDGVYQVGVDRAKPNSKDQSCRVWMKKGISGKMIIVAEEHYR